MVTSSPSPSWCSSCPQGSVSCSQGTSWSPERQAQRPPGEATGGEGPWQGQSRNQLARWGWAAGTGGEQYPVGSQAGLGPRVSRPTGLQQSPSERAPLSFGPGPSVCLISPGPGLAMRQVPGDGCTEGQGLLAEQRLDDGGVRCLGAMGEPGQPSCKWSEPEGPPGGCRDPTDQGQAPRRGLPGPGPAAPSPGRTRPSSAHPTCPSVRRRMSSPAAAVPKGHHLAASVPHGGLV